MAKEQLLVFRLGSEEYAVSRSKVKEIVGSYWATKVPNTPEYMEGIICLRGNVIPIVNLAIRLGLAPAELEGNLSLMVKRFGVSVVNVTGKRVLIVDAANLQVGVVVDEVKEVLNLEEDAAEMTQPIIDISCQYILSIAKLGERRLMIVNLDKLFCEAEQATLRAAAR